MALASTFLTVTLFVAAVVLAAGAVYKYFIYRDKVLQNKVISILLFEHIGNDKVFLGKFKGMEEEDQQLGSYILINKVKKGISLGSNADYFLDARQGKCLMVCKYADDDYRSMARLKSDEWFVKVDLPVEEYLEVEEVKDKDGEVIDYQVQLDKNGEPVPQTDKNDEPLPSFEYQKYSEPIGVNQSAREAMRFNRDFQKRMAEKRGDKENFWDKYGNMIITVGLVMIMFMAMAYNTNKTTETQKYIADSFSEEAIELRKQMESPTFIKGIYEKARGEEKEADAPPK